MFGKTQRGVSERSTKPKQPLIPKWLGDAGRYIGCTLPGSYIDALETVGTG